MRTSVELSMYPLDKDFVIHISDYIEGLKSYSDIEVISNTMSTQVFGDYDRVMEVLRIENKKAMEKNVPMVIVSKLINADLSPKQS